MVYKFDVSALTFMQTIDIILHLIRLKMESDKDHICYYLCFVFIKRKVLLMYTKLFMRRMMKML